MKHKPALDRETAHEMGVPYRLVQKITASFFDKVVRALAEEGSVDIPRFARLEVRLRKRRAKLGFTADAHRKETRKVADITLVYVRLYKKTTLKRAVEGFTMEKYGVDETANTPTDDEKIAAPKTCWRCGGTVEKHGKVLICVNCGTAPFEESK
jgi:nucleoid DNA-binding protein/ribosomal protein S27AE